MDSFTWRTLNVKQNLLKKKKHKENIGGHDNRERCLYIYFSLGNNYNFIEFHNRKNLSAPYPYMSHTLQMVHKDPFSSHLYLPTFPNLHPPNTQTSRGTNTLHYPKQQNAPYNNPTTPCPLKNSAIPSTPTPTTERKKSN